MTPSVNRRTDTYGTTFDLTEGVNQVEESTRGSEWNNVYAILHPSFYFSTHAEPAALVSRYTGTLSDLLEDSERCTDIKNALQEVGGQDCGVPLSAVTTCKQLYNVHNRSKTVLKGRGDQKQLHPAHHDPPIPEPF